MAEIEFLPLPNAISEARPERVESLPASPAPPASTSQEPAAQTTARDTAPGTIHFRPLTPEEIDANVRPDYESSGNPLPDPAISTFLGALAGDQVIAYLCLQVKLHAQPLVIRDGHAGVLKSLVHAAEAHILATVGPTWVYLFTPAGKLAQIAQSMGMQLEPWCVMSKLINFEQPSKPAFEVLLAESHDPGPFPEQEQYQARGDDSAWESLFPNGVLPIDPTGRVQ